MPITPLPAPPSRLDPVNFSARGDEFLAALPLFAEEMNAGTPGESAFGLAQSLASVLPGSGGALVGIQDAAGRFASANVEAALSEVALKAGETGQPFQALSLTVGGRDIGTGPNSGGASAIAQNIRFGKDSMLVNTTGYSLTAMGYETLATNTVGYNLTAFGRSALRFNLDGINNTAVGVVSLENNTSGSGNTAIGVSSLVTNTTGSNNTGLGFKAGFGNLSASGCTAVGTTALEANSTGANNTALGYEALSLATGANNTAVGMDAGINVTTGANNVAVGKSALFASGTGNQNTAVGSASVQGVANFSNTTGIGYNALNASTANGNTAIGASAGSSNTSGSNNLFVGYLAGTDAVDTVTTGSNRIVVGNNSHTVASIKVAWTVTSDQRDKTAFAAIPHGLAFVNALLPTAFKFRETRGSSQTAGPLRYGFKAQDILALEGVAPVIINSDDAENLKYNESSLVPVLVKAIQELTARVVALEAP
jgi:hypothetical protein